jgi:hypothetical protein
VDETSGQLRSILDLTGWTQTRLVHELRQTARQLREPAPAGLNVVTVNRWKQGRQSPSGYYRRLIRHLYESTRRSAIGSDEVESMKRRQFLAYSTVLTGTAALEPVRLARTPPRRALDGTLVDSLSDLVHGSARLWYTLPPSDLLAPTCSQLGVLNGLRALSLPGPIATRLTALAAHVSALAGWLSWLSGQREGASAYYAFGHGLASEAHDRGTEAFILALRSFTCSDLFRAEKGGTAEALALLDRAVELAGKDASPYLRVFALGRRAEEHAISGASGAEVAAGRDLDLAEQALAGAGEPDPGFFGYSNADRLAGCRGTCAVMLGKSKEAVDVLSAVLDATPRDLVGERSILLTDLAAAYAQQAEVGQACDALSRSLAVGAPGDANRVERILSVRRASLDRWSDAPAVRRLDEQLREAAGAAAF